VIQKQCNVLLEQAEAYKCGRCLTRDIVPQEVHQIIQSACDGLRCGRRIQRSSTSTSCHHGEPRSAVSVPSGGSAYLRAALPVDREVRYRARAGLRSHRQPFTADTKYVNDKTCCVRAAQLVVALGLALCQDKWSAAFVISYQSDAAEVADAPPR
jgi:hypothetical protein